MMQTKFSTINSIFAIFLTLILIVALLNIDPNITQFISIYGTYILLLLLLSISIFIFELIKKIKKHKEHQFKFNSENKELIHKISKLSYEEKNILALFMNEKIQEKALDTNNQNVGWLENIKFIFNTGKVSGNKKIYRIDPTLAKHLSQNPNSLY